MVTSLLLLATMLFSVWSALQEVSYDDEDGYEKFWSESHVSEDFDMSLRL